MRFPSATRLVLLSVDREELACWRAEIERFLRERLALELKAGIDELAPVSGGVDFVGWRTWWNRRLVRRRTQGNLTRALDGFERVHVRSAFGATAGSIDVRARSAGSPGRKTTRAQHSTTTTTDALGATLASYSGHLRHGASWRAWDHAWREHGWLDAMFERGGWSLLRRWPTASVCDSARYGDAYRALTARAGDQCLVFWPAGRFIEFHGPQRLLAERVLGLRRASIGRADYAFTAGFPRALAQIYVRRALRGGCAVVLLARMVGGGPSDRCLTGRAPSFLIVPLAAGAPTPVLLRRNRKSRVERQPA